MSVAPGSRLGAYEIVALLGAGGMGEVYRARDTKLNRDVAVKVLPDVFAADPERLARFQREAQLLASLNHPNIGAIYGLEESSGMRALVLELVEGPTLADRIAQGPIPIDEALRIARQIVEALEGAHERGVVHRDLKPANIKLRRDGVVKVLDFGLARAFAENASADPATSPTMTAAATLGGVIIGTAAYMSPEQARGLVVDKRADIWAFGCVMYEMLAGRRLFDGATVSDTLAAVLTKEPEWNRVPGAAVGLLRRCLEKDPKRRLRDIGDAMLLVEESAQTRPGASRWPWALAAAMALVVGAVALWVAGRAVRPASQPLRPLTHIEMDLGPDVSLGSITGADAILSPDGTRLVYVSKSRLSTRRLDQAKATELAGTEGAYAPFFSPDGRWIAFFAQGKLKKISVDGGAAVLLCDAPTGRGGSWGDDGTIIATLTVPGVLSRISSAGGAPTPLTGLDQQRAEITHRWPQILPGGKAVLFTAHTTTGAFDGANIDIVSFADGRRKTLQHGGTYGRYLPSGHLIYVSRGTLFAVPFDPERLEVRGAPTPLLEEVSYNTGSGSAQLDFSRSGTLIYRSGGTGAQLVTIQWLDATGRLQPLLSKPGFYERPRLSPDGQRLALEVTEGASADIWIYELSRDTMTRLTFGGGGDPGPIWSPDGRSLAFQAPGGMFLMHADGTGQPQRLTESKRLQFPWSFTRDGRRLAFMENSESGYHLWTLPLEAGSAGPKPGKPEMFLYTSFDERHPAFSPDGRWLAYASNESGSFQVYVRAFPESTAGPSGKWQISNSGGVYPEWSRNSSELFFRTEDNLMMVANYTAKGDSFVADKPRVWSEKRLANIGLTLNYDIASDGKRVAGLQPANSDQRNHVILLQNFFDEVQRRVAATGK
jgi:Tol biopolymer transport system component